MNCLRVTTVACGIALAGCAAAPQTAPAGGSSGATAGVAAPSLGWFSNIKAPSGYEPALKLTAKGVQIFRCERRDSGYGWMPRQPEAELRDERQAVVGRHGANFSFEHTDGSRLLGTVAAYEDAPKSTDLRWLLLSTKPYGKGTFGNVAYVQRVNTSGGMPPARCEAAQLNQLLRVDFAADFVFYRAR